MTSIYEQAMGDDFDRLHPKVRERFSVSVERGFAWECSGVMDEVWRGPAFTLPFLALGRRRHILFPGRGTGVPFTLRNYAYIDGFGRQTVTWARTFVVKGRKRHFDATMVYSEQRDCAVDYLGTHQHLAVDLELWADEEGAFRLRSGEQRFYEGPVAFRFPSLLTGSADVREWWDERLGRFRITVDVSNQRVGPLFGYRGSFTARKVPGEPVPSGLRPRREEHRE